jgi:Transcriptional regulator/sugar kinase
MPKEARATRFQAEVVSFIRRKGEISRADLSIQFDLDKKSSSLLIDELLEEGLVSRTGFRDSSAGRRQELFSIDGAYGDFIGIDLGATHIIGILADFSGRPLQRIFYAIRPGLPVEIILDQMKTICSRLVASDKASAELRSIAICAPGFFNPTTGTSLMAENIPGWHDVKLKEIFEGEFHKPVVTDDASRAFALAELWLGQGRDAENFILADLGYGIGMGIVLGGEPYAGIGNKSGELGHVVVLPGGPACACGNSGCLEAVASGRAIARDALAGIGEGRSELLRGLTRGSPETVTAQDVFIAANMGDGFCAELVRAAGERIGAALAGAATLLNPSRVILGGGLVAENRLMVESVAASLSARCMRDIAEDLELRVSALGIDGSALGSVMHAAAAWLAH